jgi:hypothetical protein
MSETIELQACERCSKETSLESMSMMEDCWFCADCTADFQKHFDACDHKWSPHVGSMGDPGQYCERCTGFVADEDFATLFPALCPGGVDPGFEDCPKCGATDDDDCRGAPLPNGTRGGAA